MILSPPFYSSSHVQNHINKQTFSTGNSWFYIHILFNLVANASQLEEIKEKNRETFAASSKVSPNLYLSYVTEEKYQKLSKFPFIKLYLHRKSSKTRSALGRGDAPKNYIFEACPYLDISRYPFPISRQNGNFYTATNVVDTKPLSDDPCVLSYSILPPKKTMNRYSGGYIQSHENYLSYDPLGRLVVRKTLNEAGLDGKNQVLTIMDSGIDINHDFFFDPNQRIPISETNKNHRKIIRIENYADGTDFIDGHGTHVAGIALGESLRNDSVSSLYNGIAPKAKLYMVDFANGNVPDGEFNDDEIIKHMAEFDSGVSSNSWGFDEHAKQTSDYYDWLAYQHPSILFVYSAGNTQGEMTILSPADSKNILTVGMTSPPSINSAEKLRFYSISNGKTVLNNVKVLTNSEKIDQNNTPFDIYHNIPIAAFSSKNGAYIYFENDICSQIPNAENNHVKVLIFADDNVDCSTQYQGNMVLISVPRNNLEEISKMISISIYPNCTKNDPVLPNYYSSQGPGQTGITKPDISAPGITIYSAKGASSADYTGDTSKKVIKSSSGTSMSVPAISGGATLIRQYFMDGRYHHLPMKPSSSMMKAILINSAIPFSSTFLQTYHGGFGVPQLDKALGLTANMGAQFLDKVEITSGQHHVYELRTKFASDLSITMSYLDPPSKGPYILYADLSIILETPDHKTYTGNGLKDSAEDLFTLNEKIMIQNAEAGVYKLHVYSSDFDEDESLIIKYSIAVSGGFATSDTVLVSTSQDQCPPMCKSGCKKGRCLCDSLKKGFVCQTPVNPCKFNLMKQIQTTPRHYNWYEITTDLNDEFNISLKTKDNVIGHVCLCENELNSNCFCDLFKTSTNMGTFYSNGTTRLYIAITAISQQNQDIELKISSPNHSNLDLFEVPSNSTSVPNNDNETTDTPAEKSSGMTTNAVIVFTSSVCSFIVIVIIIGFVALKFISKNNQIAGATHSSSSSSSGSISITTST